MSKVRNTEVWHGQLLVISNDWDVKGLVVKVCRVSIGNMEKERERERESERERERERATAVWCDSLQRRKKSS